MGGFVCSSDSAESFPKSVAARRHKVRAESSADVASLSKLQILKPPPFAPNVKQLEQKYLNRALIISNWFRIYGAQDKCDSSGLSSLIFRYSAFAAPTILDYLFDKLVACGGHVEPGIFRVSANSRVINRAADILSAQRRANPMSLECGHFDLQSAFETVTAIQCRKPPLAVSSGRGRGAAAKGGRSRSQSSLMALTSGTPAVGELDGHTFATLIKMWFRQSQMNVLSDVSNEQLLGGKSLCTMQAHMNEVERELLSWVLRLAVLISEHKSHNRMTAQNISIIFSPCLMSDSQSWDEPKLIIALMERSQTMVKFMCNCIEHIRAQRTEDEEEEEEAKDDAVEGEAHDCGVGDCEQVAAESGVVVDSDTVFQATVDALTELAKDNSSPPPDALPLAL